LPFIFLFSPRSFFFFFFCQVRLILMLAGSGGDLEALFATRRESRALGLAVVQESLDLFLTMRRDDPPHIVYAPPDLLKIVSQHSSIASSNNNHIEH
jgi:hypothetical protein